MSIFKGNDPAIGDRPMAEPQRALPGERWVLFGNRIAARFALLCLVAYVLNAHHVVTCHANINLYHIISVFFTCMGMCLKPISIHIYIVLKHPHIHI